MKRIATLAILAAVLAGCSDSGGADSDGDGTITQAEAEAEMAGGPGTNMRPGNWETKIEYTELNVPGIPEEMKDMFKRNMGSGITSTQCLTEEDMEEPSAEFFGAQQQEGCSYEEFDRSGNRMTIKMTCEVPGGGVSKTALEGEFSDDSYTLDIDGTFAGGPTGDVTMKGTISGKRIGDCG